MKFNLLKIAVLQLILLCTFFANSQEILTGERARSLFPNAEMVRTSKYSTVPSYIKFMKGKELDLDNFLPWTQKNFKLNPAVGFELINIENDVLGHKHYRYQQTYNGKPVEFAVWLVHCDNDKIYSMNGLLYTQIDNSGGVGLNESSALNYALNHVGANTYKWELPQEEEHVKRESGDPSATYYPTGELVYVSSGATFQSNSYHLAYKFNIYAHEPVSRAELYIDASTGQVLFENEIFHNIDVTGSAQTVYSGTQTIITDSFGGSYRLRESGRGNGVNTYDMNQGTSYGGSVDFTDTDNIWNNANAQLDEYATDAHWGAEMTYDYFWLNHARNSIDGNGFTLNSYVHYGVNYANAFWDGQRMTYGDGNGTTWDPLTSIDIAGHEITHGLTTFTANLVYSAESGALNESFSDIFGTSVENFALPSNWDWLIGEDIGSALRSMSNPNAYGDPDTYFGTNWASLTGGDNGGVHTNSGVQNFWYYLLVTGGSGTNDNGDSYTVNGIGFSEASQIAFLNLTSYLTANSDFAEARFYSIQAAADLFGECSPQVESCTNAWYAVGVGGPYSAGVTADMSSPVTSGCSSPFTIDFSNLSSNGTTFQWDFGDGATSTLLNPSHTYNALGTYTVQLIADGGLCGIDTTIWVDYVVLDNALPCELIMPPSGIASTQNQCSGTIYDSGGPSGNYGANEDAQVTIAPLGATQVDLDFIFFDVEAGQSGSCNYDYVRVYDGPNTAAPLIDTYCNNNVPGIVSSTGSTITMVFHSDGGVQDPGYVVNWNCTLPTVPPNADFASNIDTTCNGEVAFTDLSTDGPSSWLWDFGDGNSSTAQHPFHNYQTDGTYSVTLTATNVNGSDAVTYTDLIVVILPASPTGSDDNVCENSAATLGANGSGGDLDWYNSQFGGTQVGTGASYTTPILASTTSFWVEENLPGPQQNLGPVDNTFGGGGFFNGDQHLVFDVTSPVKLKTVRVYANGAGDRYVELRNNSGIVVQTATVYMADGESVVTLNLDLPIGNDWQLGTQPGSNQDLFRNNDSPSFPYTVGGGQVSSTQSSPGLNWYYYFYDWVIESPGCTSARTEVIANVSAQSDATVTPVAPMCSGDAAITMVAAETGGTWSGTGMTGDIFDPVVAGNGAHTITYTITGSCGDVGQTTVSVADSYDATISATTTMCDDDAVAILSAVDGGGVWSGTGITNSSTGEFDPITAGLGSHTITYTISGTCGDTDTEDVVVEETLDATVANAGPFCRYENAVQLNAASPGGTWSADCGTCIDPVTGMFDPAIAGTGTWTVTYTFGGNCPSSDNTAIAISDCLGLNENENTISIYPNPTTGLIHLDILNADPLQLLITDFSGRIVHQEVLSQFANVVDLSYLANGAYMVTLISEEGELLNSSKIQLIH